MGDSPKADMSGSVGWCLFQMGLQIFTMGIDLADANDDIYVDGLEQFLVEIVFYCNSKRGPGISRSVQNSGILLTKLGTTI